MSALEGIDYVRGWVATALALFVATLGGVIFFPRVVWDGFLWRYLWGPVYADAHNVPCATIVDGVPGTVPSTSECVALASGGEIVAEPGYTLVSEVVYAAVLLFALIGVYILLQRLEVGTEPSFLYGLLPFIFFGGVLRVVEDAFDSAGATGSIPIEYPLNTPLISPFIYGTVFVLTLISLLVSLALVRRNVVASYERGLAGIGAVVLGVTIGYLGYLAVTTEFVSFFPQIPTTILLGTGILTALVWVGIERYRPAINAGTEGMGLVVIFAHVLDGVANVVGIDWGAELGLPYGDLTPKHPVNDAMIGVGGAISDVIANLSGGAIVLVDVIGAAWPFLVLKIAVAIVVVWIFDETIFEESPRYAMILLVAIVAVGLGPGTRDMLRATFGV